MISGFDALRGRLRRSHAWVTLRRVQREGWARAFRRRRMWAKILRTPPVRTDAPRPGSPVEVHLLCCDRDYLSAMWTLKSFYHFARVGYPLVIHVQGRISRLAVARLRRHFPDARVVQQEEATRVVERWLAERGLTRLLEARRTNPFILKLTDFPILSQSGHLLTLDSDVIFLRHPAELLLENREDPTRCVFQRDAGSSYNIPEERALAELGIPLVSSVNTGITLVPRENYDLQRCEELMAHPDVARGTGWIEQTLQALCASARGAVTFLPDSYLVSFDRDVKMDELVARHYAGPTRPLLTSEGMVVLERSGALAAIGSSGRQARLHLAGSGTAVG